MDCKAAILGSVLWWIASTALAQQPTGIAEFPEQAISVDSAIAAQDLSFGAFVGGKSARLKGADKDFGKIYKVAIGDTLVTEFDYIVRVGGKLRADFEIDIFGEKKSEKHVVPASELLTFWLDYNDGKYVQLCTQNKTNYQNGKPKTQTCFNDLDRDQRFDEVQRYITTKKPLPSPVPYRLFATHIKSINSRYELVYLGMSGASVRVAYREYSNELARPAFSNELTFPYEPSKPSTFRYKDLRFEILDVDGEGITYRITKV